MWAVGRRVGRMAGPAADRPCALQTTTDDADSMQNNTGPLDGPVINSVCQCMKSLYTRRDVHYYF